MANYASLKAAIQQVIKTNGNNEITGSLLQQSLLAMIDSLGVGYQYVGIATPSTNPGTPDQNVFYLASTEGTYTNFGGLMLENGEIAILKYNGAWSKDSTGAASAAQLNQLGQKEILLDSWGSAPETPQVGHFYYINNEVRKITELYNSGAIKTYEVIPLTYNAIYLYSGVIYMYNGVDLIPNANISGLTDNLGTASNLAASQLLVNKVNNKYLPIKAAFGINEENLVANDYWINWVGQLKRRNPTGSGSTDIQMTDGQLFYDLFNRCLFTVETGTNGSKYRKPVGNVYEIVSYKAAPSPASVATYYYAASKKLRFITAVSGGGSSIAAYAEIQITKDMVFTYNNDLYVYDGSDILPIKNDVITSLQRKTIVLTGFRGAPETPQVGDYYYSAGGQIRLITAVSGSGSITNWEVIAPSYETVYLYKGSAFLYDGSKLSLTIADTFKHSCEISTITINEELQPDASIADIKTLVLCAVKFDNSRTPANGYGKKSHPIPIGWLYYDFNNRNNIYYSFGVPDRPKLLFVWDVTISGADNAEGIMAYSVNICPNGDIVCVPRAEYFLNRTYNPIVYKHTDYEHPVEVNVSALNSAGVSVKPVGWFGNAGVCTKTSGNYMVFGEYARPQVEPANAWKVVAPYDNPASWSIVYATTGTGEGTREIEHFHSVNYDMFSDRLYIATGDEGNESYIMESTDDGENWTKVFGGTTATKDMARALNMIFTNDACYYGSDNTGALCKISRDGNGHLDFTTVEFVIDRYGNGNGVFPGMDGYNGGVTYYTCLIDEPFGLLLLQYREGSSTEGILFYFYDIENNVIQIVGKFGTFSTKQCGFRCDAVNYYLSRLDGRVVAGYGFISNYNDIAGNKGNDYRNLTLKVI